MKIVSSFILVFAFTGIVKSQSSFPAGDTISTPEILVESNRIKTSLLLAPNKIQILNEEKIYSMNGSKLSDALSYSDAVFMRDYGFSSGLKTISINSTQTEHTLLLLDGVRLNTRQNNQFDFGTLQLGNIDRIEISKGGSSALYGSESIGGVINLITKSSDYKKLFGINTHIGYGSYNKRKIFLSGYKNFIMGKDKYSVAISYSNESSENNYQYYFFDGLNTVLKHRENSEYSGQMIDFNSEYENNNTNLRLHIFLNEWERNIPGIESGTKVTSANQTDKDILSTVFFQHKLRNKISFSTEATYRYFWMKYIDTSTLNLLYPINSYYKQNIFSFSSEVNIPVSAKDELITGYDFNFNNLNSNETEYGRLFNTALFLLGKKELYFSDIGSFVFYPSARFDYYSNLNKSVLTEKMGINYKPFVNTELTLKSSIGNNYRVPSFNELYWKDLGNKELQPERAFCIDGGLFYKFKLIANNYFEISYFNNLIYNRIIWQPDETGIWRPVNIGKVKAYGTDLSLSSDVYQSSSLTVNLRFNYNLSESLKANEDYPGDPAYNKQLIYTPKEFAKVSSSVVYIPEHKIFHQLSLNIFYSFIGRRYTNPDNTRFAKYYELIDANVNFILKLLKTDFNVKLEVNNLLNENYQVIPGYPMALRNYSLDIGIKYQ